ncbi:four helix bundle protein [Hymenobacter glacieicola]|uniref:Four helix bundle protein n=1 Tax=Hymenobacter glacieicola TaxID=1562124 RepID=A0ABQ1X6F0_9BACT|nr:four helix bundle protein [Hymenobacter glacieicola]GGG62096.1 four helix bundle protein [Hymenobacter glacieicola]
MAVERRSKPHYKLDCWRLAFDFVPVAYDLAHQFPPEERYELASQLRQAATSVTLNIAEGAGRNSAAEFTRFLFIARGSVTELDTIVLLAERLGYISSIQTDQAITSLDRITGLITGLIKSLQPNS